MEVVIFFPAPILVIFGLNQYYGFSKFETWLYTNSEPNWGPLL